MADKLEILILVKDQASKAFKGLGGALSKVGSIAKSVALGGLAAIGTGITAVGGLALNAALEFEEATNAIIKGTGASGQSLEDMEQSTKNLKGSLEGVGHDFETIGATLAEVNTRTGATGQALEDLTGDILELSRVTGDDAVESTRLITRVMGDWGVEMDDASGLIDQLHGAGQAFGIGVDSMSQKLVQFGAPLRQMGFSIEESIALFGKWEKEGVNTELAIGSLRIAAGKFAKDQQEANTQVIGGVKSMEEAQKKLVGLQQKLQVATLRQGEFTEKTKESTRVQSQMRIDTLRQQIQELEVAMAQGEMRTVASTTAQKSLKDSLQETFTAIQNAKTETEALAIGMETFGARAGPDMTAAIREGRFALDEAILALQGTSGGLEDAANRTLTLGERFGLLKSKFDIALIPIGQSLIDLAEKLFPDLETAMDSVAGFISGTVAPAILEIPGVVDAARETFNSWSEEQETTHKQAADLTTLGLQKIRDAFGETTEATNETTGGLRIGGQTLSEFTAKLFSLNGILQAITTAKQLWAITVFQVGNAFEIAGGIISNVGKILNEVSKIIRGMASNLSKIGSRIGQVVGRFISLQRAAERAARAIPRWLRPGSPTPFELGLRGIADASDALSKKLPGAFGGIAPTATSGAAAGNGGGLGAIQIAYSPVVSTASAIEIENNLIPLIVEGLRKRGIKI